MNHTPSNPGSTRRGTTRLAAISSAVGLCATFPGAEPAFAGQDPASAEVVAIEQVLQNYRTGVSNGDEALFVTTLLNDHIPFYAVRTAAEDVAAVDFPDLQGVPDFRQRIFHGGQRYQQTFDQIEIDQHGALAQASLHFVTRIRDSDQGGEGWKTLTLLKVAGRWKIASEFYTVAPLSS
ncbi:hypothetical protein BH10PSE1_BH10PSE1_29650 [soil metagenome]